ncbi:MAG: amidohydrolase [Gammaproteobacteria bacterium]|jgi:predicted amidohydrolase YtcJ
MNNSGRRYFLNASLVLMLISSSVLAQSPLIMHYADMVLYNGHIITADDDFSIAEAVAIRDGKFLAVGTTAEILPLAGANTRRIDLRGKSMTPGFIYSDGDNAIPGGDLVKESQWGGTIQGRIGGETMEQVETTITYIAENEVLEGEIIFLKVSDQWAGPMLETWDKSRLDELSPNNPTMLLPDCCHAIANSKLLEVMANEGFPENHFHLIKDESGEPTGQLGANAVGFVGRELRPFPPPEWIQEHGIDAAKAEMEEYAAAGITTATGHMTGLTVLVLNRLFKSGDLRIRVYPGLDLMRQNAFPERTLARVGNIMDFALVDERGPMVQIVGTAVGPHTGAPDAAISLMTIEPKINVIPELGRNPNGYDRWSAEIFTGKGTQDLTLEELKDTEYYNLMLARQYGYNVNGVHNMGSGGIKLSMEAIIDAENLPIKYVPELSRAQALDHNIDWVQENYDFYKQNEAMLKDKIRFGVSLGSAMRQRDADILGYEDVIELQYGYEGLERMAPLKSLVDNGIPFHIEGTDPRNKPMKIVKDAVTRIDRHGRVIAPHEALTREQAILAITRWAARFMSAEDVLGTIEAGKLADLVVFDGNILEVPIEEIDQVETVLTLVGGSVAYEKTE